VQNPGCAVEFAPAEGLALRPRDIDNLSIGKAVRAYLAIVVVLSTASATPTQAVGKPHTTNPTDNK